MQNQLINNPQLNSSIIRLKTLTILTGLSRSTIYDKQNPKSPRFDPLFPQKINLGARAVGWFLKDIEFWLNSARNKPISVDKNN
jgi:prophage regulatory protein